MTVVVADTSPLNYLILIKEIDLLRRLYGTIIIPNAVLDELSDDGAPRQVSEWATKLPVWVEVRSAPNTTDPTLSLLDDGERCAILLAQSEAEVLLLIDEAAGRLEASRRGIPNTGTVGVLRKRRRTTRVRRTEPQKFRITHPFHPLTGREFEALSRKEHGGEHRVCFLDKKGPSVRDSSELD